ncbi:hypothetical protein PTI98_010394 [Pleurotus ostreatus]|nr:hypothetical protein PTI98_010394 [Pleurotus ostreatus]
MATSTLCQICSGQLPTDACPTHTTVYNIHDNDINISTTAPVYQSFGCSTNQGNTQFEEQTMGPGMGNAMHTEGYSYGDNDQGIYPYTFLFPNVPIGQAPTIRTVGSPAITAASQNRRRVEARFQCQFQDCGKTFTAKHNLDSHMRAHLDIRPHGCNCGSTFTAKGDLKRHQKSQQHAGAMNQMYLSPN